jgi:hypothetical protein
MTAVILLSNHRSSTNGFRLFYSIIPAIGTVVGGLIGLEARMIGSWAARSALDGSGLTTWAKEGLGGVLNNFNEPIGKAWDWTSEQTAAISDTTSRAWNATTDTVCNAASIVAGGVSDAATVLAKRGAG